MTSWLARVEVLRAVRRMSPYAVPMLRARQVMDGLTLLRTGDEILERAAALDPTSLRSLDALHLATALSLGRDLGPFITYDLRLAAAAAAARLEVVSPGEVTRR